MSSHFSVNHISNTTNGRTYIAHFENLRDQLRSLEIWGTNCIHRVKAWKQNSHSLILQSFASQTDPELKAPPCLSSQPADRTTSQPSSLSLKTTQVQQIHKIKFKKLSAYYHFYSISISQPLRYNQLILKIHNLKFKKAFSLLSLLLNLHLS